MAHSYRLHIILSWLSETFEEMYGIEAEDVNDFAIDCCHQQIEGVYGDRSLEQIRFDQAVGF